MCAQGHDDKEASIMTLRRSIHFVPGGNDKMLSKALGLSADSLILDLEDSVTPERKEAVRAEVCVWLKETNFGKQERLVRINPMDTAWGRDDLEAVLQYKPDGIVLPKVLDLKAVQAVDQLIVNQEKQTGEDLSHVKLLLIGTEMAAAVFNLPKMVTHPRVNGVTWGAEDLSVSLGARAKRDADGNYLEVFGFVRSMCLLAAVAAEVQPIDAVYVDIQNSKGLEKECNVAADMGFTGKITIHPNQIEIVNRAFTPSDAEIAEAKALVSAFEEHQKAGKMAFTFNGAMVDVPHLKQAQKILAIAAHIVAQTS
ncbi:MAG: CoA ester lyase [SAR86 cluster bacterium]|uniref:CoA ester lyase n=1 Tax=SAR86 cluster bacterium TaxID=2030880 RepID=A0A2A5AE58_9GAMM|nr:MAG: CoA ester lyase [SAR86 cluster bacterium]